MQELIKILKFNPADFMTFEYEYALRAQNL